MRAIRNFFIDYWRLMCGRPLLGERGDIEVVLPASTIAWSVIDHHQLDPALHPILENTIRRARNDGEMLARTHG